MSRKNVKNAKKNAKKMSSEMSSEMSSKIPILLIDFTRKSGVNRASIDVDVKIQDFKPTYEQPISKIKKLFLDNLGLISIPPEIGGLKNLEMLGLSENKLTRLPEEIGNLTDLDFLYLSKNQLTSLPKSVGNLTRLKRLDLSRNQLTSLPEEIGNLTDLEVLDLSGNQLTSLPEEIGNLTNLKILDLTGNQLTSFPESIMDIERAIKIEPDVMAKLMENVSNWSRRQRFGQFHEALNKYYDSPNYDSPRSPKNTPTKSEIVLFNKRFAKEIGKFLGGKSYRKKRTQKRFLKNNINLL